MLLYSKSSARATNLLLSMTAAPPILKRAFVTIMEGSVPVYLQVNHVSQD